MACRWHGAGSLSPYTGCTARARPYRMPCTLTRTTHADTVACGTTVRVQSHVAHLHSEQLGHRTQGEPQLLTDTTTMKGDGRGSLGRGSQGRQLGGQQGGMPGDSPGGVATIGGPAPSAHQRTPRGGYIGHRCQAKAACVMLGWGTYAWVESNRGHTCVTRS